MLSAAQRISVVFVLLSIVMAFMSKGSRLPLIGRTAAHGLHLGRFFRSISVLGCWSASRSALCQCCVAPNQLQSRKHRAIWPWATGAVLGIMDSPPKPCVFTRSSLLRGQHSYRSVSRRRSAPFASWPVWNSAQIYGLQSSYAAILDIWVCLVGLRDTQKRHWPPNLRIAAPRHPLLSPLPSFARLVQYFRASIGNHMCSLLGDFQWFCNADSINKTCYPSRYHLHVRRRSRS